jgi:predicted anti-sigma-YlaC factor YlaD
MKCSLIRDLLPLYVEGDCSEDTSLMVKEHLESCFNCGELFKLMKYPIDIKVIDQTEAIGSADGNEFWKKYYGRLILNGTGLFLSVYITVVVLMVLLK